MRRGFGALAAVAVGVTLLGCGSSPANPGADGGKPMVDGGPPGDGGISGTWAIRTSLPSARQELVAVTVGDALYVIGGLDANTRGLAEVLVFTSASDRWQSVAPYPFAVDHASAAVVDGNIYVMGGSQNFQPLAPLKTVYSYDPGTNQWQPRADMPFARWGSAAAAAGGKIYVAGGTGEQTERVMIYDPASNTWEAPSGLVISPRDHLAAAAVDGKVYFMGGRTAFNVTLVDELDPNAAGGPSVRERAPMPTARGGMSAAVVNGAIFVPGGENLRAAPGAPNVYEQLEVFLPAENRWVGGPAMRTPRHGLGVAALGGEVFTIGGGTVAGLAASEVVESLAP